MKRLLGLAIWTGIVAGSMQAGADAPISITVRPSVATYHGNAMSKVLVSRDERNRLLVWEVDGPGYYRSSAIELDGAAAPRSYLFMAKELPAGEFEVRATVKRSDRSHSTDRRGIRVVGGPEGPG
jgi:hypothetical protein